MSGKYKMECWGAQGGGNTSYPRGKGSYTRGTLGITTGNVFYVVVGQNGSAENYIFNNGFKRYWFHNSGYIWSGGGSTDIRLNDANNNWTDFVSRKSRIMVAASGGGSITYYNPQAGVPGGSLVGFPGTSKGENDGVAATAGTQTKGGTTGTGSHSIGKNEIGFGYIVNDDGLTMGGAGNGYYAGGKGNHGNCTVGVGATGSCYISGYTGCNAITESCAENAIAHTGSPNHYSGYVFTNATMIAGNAIMPSPSGGNETGHGGDGTCIITQTSFKESMLKQLLHFLL